MMKLILVPLSMFLVLAETASGGCPEVHNALTQNGNFDELGVVDLEDVGNPFTVQVEGDLVRSSQLKSAGGCYYQLMSYDSDGGNDMGDLTRNPDYNMTANQWHRVKIDHASFGAHIVYFNPPTYYDCNGYSPDFLIGAGGGAWKTSCPGIAWSSVLQSSPPSDWHPPAPTGLTVVPSGIVSGPCVDRKLTWAHSWKTNVPEISFDVYRAICVSGAYAFYASTSSLSLIVASDGYYKVYAKLDNVLSAGTGPAYVGCTMPAECEGPPSF